MNSINVQSPIDDVDTKYLPDTKPWRYENSKGAHHRCVGVVKRGIRKGQRCPKLARIGRKGCVGHGGNTPTGAACTLYKTGRYSKYLPEKIAGRYQEMLSNTRLLSLIDEIALVDAKVAETFESAPATVDSWKMVREAVEALSELETEGKPIAGALNELIGYVDAGYCEAKNWDKAVSMIEQRRKLVETERRLTFDEQHSLTIDKVMLLVSAIIDAIRRNVRDPKEQQAVGTEIRALVERNG